jgi:cyclopropane fatty-acyl-phospholipid synthase-like methyltransferase
MFTIAKKSHASQIEHYYDRWGWIYPLLWGETIHWGLFNTGQEGLAEATRHWTDRTVQLLGPREGQRFLEIGCGPAVTAHRLIETNRALVDAIEISEFQLKRARSFPDCVMDGRLGLIKGDIAETALPRDKYDGAFSEAVFFHLFKKEICLKNIRRALHSGARFVFDDLIRTHSTSANDLNKAFRRFGDLELYLEPDYSRVLHHAGFRLEEVISASNDVAITYMRLLDRLEEVHSQPESVIPQSMYVSLQSSFREIVALLKQGRMDAKVFVVTAI